MEGSFFAFPLAFDRLLTFLPRIDLFGSLPAEFTFLYYPKE